MPNKEIKFKRHHKGLSPTETDELIDALAELIVNYVKENSSEHFPARHTGSSLSGDQIKKTKN